MGSVVRRQLQLNVRLNMAEPPTGPARAAAELDYDLVIVERSRVELIDIRLVRVDKAFSVTGVGGLLMLDTFTSW